MSIASALTRLAAAKTAIINAITEMGGNVSEGDGFENLALAVKEIPTSDELVPPPINQLCVEFFDWDTQKFLGYKRPEDFPLSEMPPLPETTRTDIVPYKWSYTLEDLNSAVEGGFYPCVICLYDTIDHLNHVIVDIPYDNFTVKHWYKAKNRIINWDDGTIEDLSDNSIPTSVTAGGLTVTHTYEKAGRYNITIQGSINGAYNSGDIYIIEPKGVIYGIYLGTNWSEAKDTTSTGTYLNVACEELSLSGWWDGNRCAKNMPAICSNGYNTQLGGGISKIKRIGYRKNLATVGWNSTHSLNSNSCINLQIRQLPKDITELRANYIGCESMTYINIPSTVTSITGTFQNCYNLRTVNLPSNLTKIEANSFSGCMSLELDTLPNTITTLGNAAFAYCYKVKFPTLPTSLTSIGQNAFNSCGLVTFDTFPNAIKSIGNYAFYQCSLVTFSSLPSSLTSMGIQAFVNCSLVTFSSLPSGLTSLPNQVFQGCTSISNFTIHENVTAIGMGVFAGCSSLQWVKMLKTTPPTLQNISAFPTSNPGFKIIVPNGSLTAYSTTTNWSNLYNNGYLEEEAVSE